MASGEQVAQAFRVESSSKIITIPARLDPKCGKHIVLWRDVQQIFVNARAILNNGEAVVFLTDDNFEYLTPWRIAHHPGAVLDVVVGNFEHELFTSTQNSSQESTEPSSTTTPCSASGGSLDVDSNSCLPETTSQYEGHTPSLNLIDDTEPAFQRALNLSISGMTSTEGALTLHPGRSTNETYSSTMEVVKAGQVVQETSIGNTMDELFNQLRIESNNGGSLQELMVRMALMQQNTQHHLLEMRQQMEANHQQMIYKQQQTLDRLAIIQNRVQAIINQTYELHEYPIPRLFIVLPWVSTRREKIRKPFAHQFRLYFLCECGTHTMAESSKTQHEIHLAKHEGYDLDKPTEFFQKYGNYVLALMYMIKYGVMTAGFVVPPLANFKVDSVEEHLNHLKNIEPLVDDSIGFLQGLSDDSYGGMTEEGDLMQLDKLEVLEGADLRQLESYLKVKDEYRVLGNLYRIVTPEGHVKWVCIDHYRSNYRESALLKLREAVLANQGYMEEKMGEVRVGFSSSALAKQFYSALVGARGIQKLTLNLAWDASMDDFRKMAEAVTSANIVDFTLNGLLFEGSVLDVVNRGRRYDPIMRLMANGRIQTLQLVLFKDLFSRLSHKAFTSAPKLRVLKLHSPIDGSANSWKTNLQRILENCPNIREFGLRLQDQNLIVPVFEDILDKLQDLRVLEIYFGDFLVTADVIQGRVHTLGMFLPPTETLTFEGSNQKTYSKDLDEELSLAQVVRILRLYPTTSEIKMRYENAHPNTMIEAIANTRREVEAISLKKVDLVRFTGSTLDVRIIMDFIDHEGATLGCSLHLSMSSWSIELKPYYDIISRHGSSFKVLDARKGCIDDEIARSFEQSTVNNSKLGTLILDTWELANEGLECMDRVISRSKSLERFVIDQSISGAKFRDRATFLISRHGRKLTGLSFRVVESHQMTETIEWLVTTFPSRLECPRLSDFQLTFPRIKGEIPDTYVQWLALMLTAPGPQPTTPSTETSDTAHAISKVWSPLTRLCLQYSQFSSDGWKSLIEAIEFSTLEILDLSDTNFADEQLDLLIECVVKAYKLVPLRTLDLMCSTVSRSADPAELYSKLDEFRGIAPHLAIMGLGIAGTH
ncbi:MAG: hypothetical protein J3Q66DRAFT_166969 [Benniella sp.]|nr:MAG: hypothetical protein J3Q66DRAFT_166969 [Benniella sp.]